MKKNSILIASALLIASLFLAIYRPDLRLALQQIGTARDYAEDHYWVNLAARYLTFVDSPQTYPQLKLFILNCHLIESPYERPIQDYSAIQAAKILGISQNRKSRDVLFDILATDIPGEPNVGCQQYAFDGLVIKPNGYKDVLSIAMGATDNIIIRDFAIGYLGRSGDEAFTDSLTQLAFQDKWERIRIGAVRALAKIGTREAIKAVEFVSLNDLSQEVRSSALEELENLHR